MSEFDVRIGDACDFLDGLERESVDLVITDPAYESLEKHRAKGTTTRLKQSEGSSNPWFPIFPNERFEELFPRLWRVMKKDTHLYLFCDQETMFVVKPIAELTGFTFWKPLVWDKCLAPETGVITDGGVQRIESVVPGDKIAASDGEFYPVQATKRLRGQAFRIEMSDGTAVIASGDHLFRSQDQWKETKNLAPGDEIDVSCPETLQQPIGIKLDTLIKDEERILELPPVTECLWCGQQFASSRSAAAHQARFCKYACSKKTMAKTLGVPFKRIQYWLNRGQIPAVWASKLGLEGKTTGRIRLRMANDPYHLFPSCLELDHEFGRVIGLYAAEGSRGLASIGFHFNENRKTLINFVSMYFRHLGIRPRLAKSPGCITVKLHHIVLPRLIRHFISGSIAPKKRLMPPVYASELGEFRKGIYWGLLEGDGSWEHKAQRQKYNSSSIDLAMFVHREVARRGWRVRTKKTSSFKAGAYTVVFDPSVKNTSLRVENVIPAGEVDLIDISVGSPDSSFLLENGAVTHNCSIGMGYHYRSQYEFILFFEKGKRKLNDLSVSDVLQAKRIRGGYPTQKPVDLITTLVLQSSEPGEVVVDPFSGSGSAGAAAVQQGRSYLGGDIQRSAVEGAITRLVEAGGDHKPGYQPNSTQVQGTLF